jgi:uncharacterized protein with HEPN domain
MRDAVRTAVDATKGRGREDLDSDEILRLALTHVIEIIGEAANHISPKTQERAPQIPWEQITGMRNQLIHAYFEVNLDTLWYTIQNDLPTLLEDVDKLIESFED